jgi:hypothetical protein
MVKHEVSSLTPQHQEAFVEEYRRKAKSTGVAYLLWLIGFQYAYVGKWGILVLYLLTAGGLFIWMLIDIFRVPSMVRDYNKDIAVDVLRNLKAIQHGREG